ncbi:MAG: hypothetical protein ACRD2C_17705 [Acidimicrobiales bacterium]
MRRKRKSISVTVDLDLFEAGKAAVADGRVWSFSALVNEALRHHLANDTRHAATETPDRHIAIYGGIGHTP